MKKVLSTIIIAAASCLLCSFATAQTRDIGVTAGANVPLYKGAENDIIIGINYGQFRQNGLGFRAGLQYGASLADVNDYIGLPVAFAWRTRTKTASERLHSGTAGAMESAGNMVYGRTYYDSSDIASGLIGGFLMNLFSDLEFFAGVTPGFYVGKSSIPGRSSWGNSRQYWQETWTERKNAFSFTLDAGMCLNYSIWRFDIKLIPSFHYNLMNSLIQHVDRGETGVGTKSSEVTPLRWTFTMSGGLAFRF